MRSFFPIDAASAQLSVKSTQSTSGKLVDWKGDEEDEDEYNDGFCLDHDDDARTILKSVIACAATDSAASTYTSNLLAQRTGIDFNTLTKLHRKKRKHVILMY